MRELVQKLGAGNWSTIASYIPGRVGKQCRERWLNYLRPDRPSVNNSVDAVCCLLCARQ